MSRIPNPQDRITAYGVTERGLPNIGVAFVDRLVPGQDDAIIRNLQKSTSKQEFDSAEEVISEVQAIAAAFEASTTGMVNVSSRALAAVFIMHGLEAQRSEQHRKRAETLEAVMEGMVMLCARMGVRIIPQLGECGGTSLQVDVEGGEPRYGDTHIHPGEENSMEALMTALFGDRDGKYRVQQGVRPVAAQNAPSSDTPQ